MLVTYICRRGRGGRGGRVQVGSSGTSLYGVETRIAPARRFTRTPGKEKAWRLVQAPLLYGASGGTPHNLGRALAGGMSVQSTAEAWIPPGRDICAGGAGLLIAAARARAAF